MAYTPYTIGLLIQYPAGTALANVNVTVRNERSNESKSSTTNSAGEAVFNLGSKSQFPTGWTIGDVFSYVVLYQGYEVYASHKTLATEGGYSTTAVLTAVPTAPSLRYFAPQEFLDYYNMDIYEDDAENGVKMQQMIKIGQMIEEGIDNDADTVFDDNNGSYYSNSEYIDTDEDEQIYHTSNSPIVAITSLYTTQSDEESAPDYTNNTTLWTSLTEGTDFVKDSDTGRINITNSSYYPLTRKWGLYIIYTYGRSEVPEDIKELAILETGLRMFGAAFIKSRISKFSDINIGDMGWFNNYRKNIIGAYASTGVDNWNT